MHINFGGEHSPEERAAIEQRRLLRAYRTKQRNKIARSNDGSTDKRAKESYLRILRLRGCVCERCGTQYPPCAMDFHHKKGTVVHFRINVVSLRNRKWEDIESELQKCELLCVVCHRITHCNTEWRKTNHIYTEI